ncbi:MAG: 16S rRNA (uracil(1498)-N(3))-methyltransferase [Spirochaetaceae bacterium]|nr:16S rRNA (uracil(1498)-N(3))-methyltransferase [Spirochaetaceae bacterium]
MNLILLNETELTNGISCHDERGQHILKVLKLKAGDSFKAGLLNVSVGLATITNIDGGIRFNYQATNKAEEPSLQPLPLILVLGMVRPLVMRRLLRDMTACGVKAIYIYNAENGERGYETSSLWKDDSYLNDVKAGLMLAGTVIMPSIKRFNSLRSALNEAKANNVVAMHPLASRSTKELAQLSGLTALVIGNERGFTERELMALNFFNAGQYTMGSRIVRTETACAMAMALVIDRL